MNHELTIKTLELVRRSLNWVVLIGTCRKLKGLHELTIVEMA